MPTMQPQKPSRDPNDRRDARTPPQSPRPSGLFRPLSPSEKKLPDPEGFIPPHGGYQNLLAYQKALVVYDATVCFCDRFMDRRSRTHDQMVQAARSGKQNILEGSEASGTSKEAEIKLTGVAKASQKELLEDYRDFMRNRGIEEWPPDHRYAMRLRRAEPYTRRELPDLQKRHRAPRPRHLRQRHRGPHQSDHLSPRPPTPPPGTRFPERRRPPRAHDPRPPRASRPPELPPATPLSPFRP